MVLKLSLEVWKIIFFSETCPVQRIR